MTLPELLSLETDLRRAQDEVLKKNGLSWSKYLDEKERLVRGLPNDFTQDLGEFTVELDVKERYAYPKSAGAFVCYSKTLKLHSKR